MIRTVDQEHTVCYYHVTYAFQIEYTLHSCLNFKERLARNKPDISRLSASNVIRTHNHLLSFSNGIRTHNHLLSGCGFESGCCYQRYIYIYISIAKYGYKEECRATVEVECRVLLKNYYILREEVWKPSKASNGV